MRVLPSRYVLLGVAATLLAACAQTPPIVISKDTITSTGTGQNVSMRGRPVALSGNSLKVGDKLPAISVTGTNMAAVDLAVNPGKVRVMSIVPSLDTATCDEQTHQLGEAVQGLDQVEVFTLSMDLPFAQRRYASVAKISNVTFLSDYRNASFGNSTGLLQPSRLLARGVMVVDKQNVIRHMQIVPDMSMEPDMKEADRVARTLL